MTKFLKNNIFLRFIYQKFSVFKVFFEIFLNFSFKKDKTSKSKTPEIYYAGAETRNIGGPYLKIKKLQKFFPENKRKFNLVYALSNSPKLTSISINILKKRKIPLILYLSQKFIILRITFFGNLIFVKKRLKYF